jgi:succinyl-diaminopimelate desuccinylase
VNWTSSFELGPPGDREDGACPAALSDLLESLTRTLTWLIGIPSVTGEETTIRDAIAERLRDLPAMKVADSLVVGEPGPGVVILAGHLDTVPLQGEVGARVEGDRVYGLGATDMKAGLAVMVHLVEVLGPERVACVFYAGEEGPLSGNQLGLVLEAAPWLTDAEAALVMEPTDRALEAGCQGVVNADVYFDGVAAHSARPWLGVNAVTRSAEFLEMMGGLEPEPHSVKGLEFREVMSITTAHGGVARNVIPAELVLNVNYRFAPDRSPEAAVARLRQVCAGADRVAIADVAPAGSVDIDQPLFRRLLAVSGAGVSAKQGWTDVAQLSVAGIPAVNFGPGEPALAHKPGESIRVSDMEWVHDILADVIAGTAAT